jgi:hypothetical protein
MDEHFAELFARYSQLAPAPVYQPAAAIPVGRLPDVALARSIAGTS